MCGAVAGPVTYHLHMYLQELSQLGFDVVNIPRGGETTYHGPGQLVAYPIINIRQLGLGARAYVEGLEQVMVQTAGCYGIQVCFAADCTCCATCCLHDAEASLIADCSVW